MIQGQGPGMIQAMPHTHKSQVSDLIFERGSDYLPAMCSSTLSHETSRSGVHGAWCMVHGVQVHGGALAAVQPGAWLVPTSLSLVDKT